MIYIVRVPSPIMKGLTEPIEVELDHVFHEVRQDNGVLLFFNNGKLVRAFSPGNWCSLEEKYFDSD